jgi:sulfite exporter TauE/SafE
MTPHLVQLLGIGLLWVSLHCVGMCGPIVAMLNAGDAASSEASSDLWSGARNVLAYQTGRAITYALMGAAVGGLGAVVETAIQSISRSTVGIVAIALLVAGLLRAPPVKRRLRAGDSGSTDALSGVGARLGRAARRLSRLMPDRGRLRIGAFGAVMGLLPCMLMFWVLGLAASTADPIRGAGLMVGLVVATTPVLVLAGTSPLLAGSWWRRHGEAITSLALMASGVWLGLVAAAANGWIAHARVAFEIGGRAFKIMLW